MWQEPPPPENEAQRLAVLEACNIMDTPNEERFDRITRLARRFYDADIAFIGFIDSGYQWIKSITSNDIDSPIDRKRSLCQVMVSSGKPLVIDDLHTDERFEGHPIVPHLPLHFYAGVPLRMTPDLVIGSLCIMRKKPGIGEDFDIEPLQELAAITVDEVELRNLNHNLTRMARVDALTGLTNRRGFDDALEHAELRCRRTDESLSVMLIDIDYFKDLNDSFGHQGGDAALRAIGKLMGHILIRADDTMARYGGEEFAAILSGQDTDGALIVAERIRAALAEAAIPHPKTGSLTVSIGISSRTGPLIEREQMIAEADAALYEAKRRGRNAVVRHQP